ncbi:hypothetical protein [Cellulomonas sp. URHB0016]
MVSAAEDRPSPRLVTHLGWGSGERDLTLRDVGEPSLGDMLDSPSGRALRPLPPVRAGLDGSIVVLLDEDPAQASRRVLVVDPRDGSSAVVVDVDGGGSVVVDLAPDGEGGVHLLEFVLGDTDATNRLRRIDAQGRTLWSRSGPVDHRTTDPEHLRGVFVRLQVATDALWVLPRATSAGLARLDPATARTVQVRPLPADVATPVVSASGVAYYALVEAGTGWPHPRLAATDLASGETSVVDCGEVPLLDLAGVDPDGRVYARTARGVLRLRPDGAHDADLRVAGVVVGPGGSPVTVAEPGGSPGAPGPTGVVHAGGPTGAASAANAPGAASTVRVTQHGADGARSWSVPVPDRTAVLVDVEPGPRFTFQVGGSRREPGQIMVLAEDGSGTGPSLTGDDAAAELFRTESRTDPATYQVAPDGTVLVTVTGPHGYSVLAWEPSAR